jgi:hypothetical protein
MFTRATARFAAKTGKKARFHYVLISFLSAADGKSSAASVISTIDHQF